MPILENIEGGHVPIKAWTRDIEPSAREQLVNTASLPIVYHHVAAMPDVHFGIGATVGSVIATKKAIIPAAVGVDIGCGMAAVRTSLTANDIDEASLKKVYHQICRDVPVGFGMHRRALADAAKPFEPGLNCITDKHPEILKAFKNFSNWVYQMGTLGGGNHFIELCLDEADNLWVMLHSGSRGIGNRIGHYFIALAREEMLKQDVHLPDKDLAYLSEGTEHFNDYAEAVSWAQSYALENRAQMMQLIITAMIRHLPPFSLTSAAVNCHHNYVSCETHYDADVWITRKGAIKANQGKYGIIPGSMGVNSYIVRGKGNPESFESCAHGAGRRMSRGQAKKSFTIADIIRQTDGVICRKDPGVIDEIPGAYKDINQVMENQADLVEIVHTLKQVVCVKG